MIKIKSLIIKYKRISLFIFLLMISIFLIILTNQKTSDVSIEVGLYFFSGFQEFINSISKTLVNTIGSIQELEQTKRELEEVRKKILEYEKISKDIISLQQENIQLRELLDFSTKINWKKIPAEIIAKQPGNTFIQFVLNKGKKDGVERYMCVVARHEGYTGLVGKVVSISETSCSVIPIFNSSFYVSARLEESRYDGIVSGQGEYSDLLIMENVDKNGVTVIQRGEIVITAGLGQVFPKGIHIGIVETISPHPYENTLLLEIKPFIELSRLEYVIIIDGGTQIEE